MKQLKKIVFAFLCFMFNAGVGSAEEYSHSPIEKQYQKWALIEAGIEEARLLKKTREGWLLQEGSTQRQFFISPDQIVKIETYDQTKLLLHTTLLQSPKVLVVANMSARATLNNIRAD